jgi:hypothetical protein
MIQLPLAHRFCRLNPDASTGKKKGKKRKKERKK